MVQICALASGSNGNCYYIGNQEHAVLVDAGISRRQVIERMKLKGLDPSRIAAIFISHEHSDHSCGVRVLSEKLDVPVYMTKTTFNNSRAHQRPEKYLPFTPGDVVTVGSLNVHTFGKRHDAVDPCSFVVEASSLRVGVLTDLGSVCEIVSGHVANCDALFLESNYDEQMLWNGPYPAYLKTRVAGNHGHLSNTQAAELVEMHGSARLKHIFLSHLSAENNLPQLALKSFSHLTHRHNVVLTNRYAPADVVML
jgi:phosphoribosyl 1,2-cyclic phosphodiesterase